MSTGLIIDERLPEPDLHAGGASMHDFVRVLVDSGQKVIFRPNDGAAREPYARSLQQAGVEIALPRSGLDVWLAQRGPALSWVLLARPNVAAAHLAAIRRRTRARIAYYVQDVHHVREQRRYEVLGDRAALLASEQLRRIERDIFTAVDVVLTPSSDEVLFIRQLAPRADVRVVPLAVYRPQEVPPPDGREGLLFVGGFRHNPNVDAALYLANEVMPLLWREAPDVALRIVGNAPNTDILRLSGPRVKVTGFVPTLDPYLERAAVSINPIRFGAGVKGKIVVSLQAGVPIVTTTIGNEGIGLTDGVDALIADDAPGLAAAALRIIRDRELARQLSEAGQRFCEANFAEATVRRILHEALGIARSVEKPTKAR